jgi:LPS export ABC transporter permease LptG
VILFVQQASRFSDIFFNISIPNNLIWQLTLALVPNVIAFTCPMAVLLGVIIGLSKMQGDSELIAIRTAGVGNLQIAIPVVFLGLLLSAFAFFINIKGVPFAAQIVRAVAVKTALYKLESPIEPGVFNTEINGFTIYVKKGDLESGDWKNVFIYQEDKQNNQLRLITSKSGRIDATDETSELVLNDAYVNTVSLSGKQDKLVSENVGQIRLAIKTKRNEIVERLSKSESTPEELGLSELAEYARNKEGKERTEAQVLWQRRILLSITPLIFALLGTGLVIRYNRRGRGFGIFLALVSLVGYYLISLLSEQLARTNSINVFFAGLLPFLVSVIVITWLFLSNRYFLKKSSAGIKNIIKIDFAKKREKLAKSNYYIDITTGILDFDIVLTLLKYFLLTFTFLTSIYLIFTAFELWKFAGTIDDGIVLLFSYLVYLIPFIYIQLAPSSLMIATLATYVIKSRQNEIVTWTASGQSIYRLLAPCFLLMAIIGVINWGIQEKIAPQANQIQDQLRGQIRNQGVLKDMNKKLWVANNERIFSFEMGKQTDSSKREVNNLTIYEFSKNESKLKTIYSIPKADWQSNKINIIGKANKTEYSDNNVETIEISNGELDVQSNPLNNFYEKPNHLTISETREQIKNRESEVEKRIFEIALEKKYTTLFLPLIITFFTAPFALSLSRKGKVMTIGYAVGIWLLFMGVTNVFDQFGQNGFLSPAIAVWSPIFLFAILGAYLLTKVKT